MYKLKKIIFTIYIFLSVQAIFSIDYYIDYRDGKDSDDGTSPSIALKHAPGDINATDNAANIILQPGDVVNFKGGVSYYGTVNINWSGSSGLPIVYNGNSDNSWGVGKAIITGKNTLYNGFSAIGNPSTDFIDIKNFEISEFDQTAYGDTSNQGLIRARNVRYWNIDNCIIRFVRGYNIIPAYDPNHEQEEPPQVGIYITTWGTQMCTDINITNCEIYAIGHCAIVLNRVENSLIKNNNIGGINRKEDAGYFLAAISIRGNSNNLIIQDNEIHDGWQYEGDIPEGQICHGHDWIHIYKTTFGNGYDMIIERNLFYINHDFQYLRGGTFGYVEDAINVTYRNNIYLNAHNSGGFIGLKQNSSGQIYNNLFISYDTTPGYSSSCISIFADVSAWEISNNIFIQYGEAPVISSGHSIPSNLVMNNNLYYSTQGDNRKLFRFGSNVPASYYTLAEWQSTNNDLNSITGDPKLESIAHRSEAGSGNFEPTAESYFLFDNAAKLLSDIMYDYNNEQRRGNWDIGPFEYKNLPATIPKPYNLKLKNY